MTARKNYRFSNTTLSFIQQALTIENQSRKKQNLKKMSETALIESMIEYCFNLKYNAKEAAQIKENERLYFTDLITKMMKIYFTQIQNQIAALHLLEKDSNEWIRVAIAAQDILGTLRESEDTKQLITNLHFDEDTKQEIVYEWKQENSKDETPIQKEALNFDEEPTHEESEDDFDYDEEDFD